MFYFKDVNNSNHITKSYYKIKNFTIILKSFLIFVFNVK